MKCPDCREQEAMIKVLDDRVVYWQRKFGEQGEELLRKKMEAEKLKHEITCLKERFQKLVD